MGKGGRGLWVCPRVESGPTDPVGASHPVVGPQVPVGTWAGGDRETSLRVGRTATRDGPGAPVGDADGVVPGPGRRPRPGGRIGPPRVPDRGPVTLCQGRVRGPWRRGRGRGPRDLQRRRFLCRQSGTADVTIGMGWDMMILSGPPSRCTRIRGKTRHSPRPLTGTPKREIVFSKNRVVSSVVG